MYIFHTTSGFIRPNISRNTRWNRNFSLPFKNLPLKLHVIQTPLQKLGRNSLYQVLNISYFSHFTSNISGQQCLGLEAALTQKTCTFALTKKLSCRQFHLKKTIELYCDLWKHFLFKMNRDNSGNSIYLILVGKCPLSVIRLQKRRNNTVNEPY